MPQRSKMHLVAYMRTNSTASYAGGWRHPSAPLDDVWSPERYQYLARLLEGACFDAGFFADNLGLPDLYKGRIDDYIGRGGQASLLDPMIALPIMAAATSRLGLGATLSTTFNEPYHLARSLGSLDLVSGGRAAWNVVTSTMDCEAQNFGLAAMPDKATRYARGDDVLEACTRLWDSWEEGALVMDRESGVFADPARIHPANHAGPHVSTRGPLGIPRSPQGRPVLMQAGSSPRGREFAARWAELVFASPATREAGIAFRADLHERLGRAGRRPEDCKVLVSLSLVLGETEAIARDRAAYLDSLVAPELVLASNSSLMGIDLDAKLRAEAAGEEALAEVGNQGVQGTLDRMTQTVAARKQSFAETVRRPRDLFTGTAAGIADVMEDWFTSGACDGFVLPPTVYPQTFEDVARLLVPELQKRGLFRREYAGRTLRENLANPG
ncbi:NtaA/DmoA family FMN-dependent monooxygenase [Oceanicella sp. SM1341]|uniref:NtaA/DmoA family FMN-dependent monooxygenase n=1 Tax=Oceanicella sp. SM1341 TaxID=1548889 RepID=UPI000E4C5B90|nr:NtaA/DmoA family FMN-dependent monooxygenase [Oceanicella sp. SM1341]